MSILDKEDFTQEDIQNLIDSKAEESLYIEFKSANSLAIEDSKKKEMAKDVSAFANSDGGLIFYGINEENHMASSVSFVNGNMITKEWIENVLISNIQPRLENLKIIPVRIEGDLSKTVFVIKIPRAKSGWPHMSRDNKYYRRYNFQSVPMEEYEVRRAYNHPALDKLEIDPVAVYKPIVNNDTIHITCYLNIINTGQTVCEKYKVACWFYNLEQCSVSGSLELHQTKGRKGVKISTSKTPPIFPEEILTAIEFTLHIPISEYVITTEKLEVRTILFYNNNYYDEDFEIKGILDDVREQLTPESSRLPKIALPSDDGI